MKASLNGRFSPKEIRTPCTTGASTLNVARDYTYQVVLSILSELKGLFVDKFLHLGMDEVDYTCWYYFRDA